MVERPQAVTKRSKTPIGGSYLTDPRRILLNAGGAFRSRIEKFVK